MAVGAMACSPERSSAPPYPVETELRLDSILAEIAEINSLVNRAEDIHISSCMREQGFVFPEAAPRPEADSFKDRSLYSDDLSWWEAEEWGYSWNAEAAFDGDESPIENSKHADYLASLSVAEAEAYNRAFAGAEYEKVTINDVTMEFPVDGCLGEAGDDLLGSDLDVRFAALSSGLSSFSFNLRARVEADSRYIDASQEWVECMKTAGYDFGTTDEAVNAAIESRTDVYEVSLQERNQAVADKDCRIESSVLSVARSVALEIESEFLNESELEALLLEWQEISPVARDRAYERLVKEGLEDPPEG